MLARFTKEEFHEWLISYILYSVDMMDVTDNEEIWYDFLNNIKNRQISTTIRQKQPDFAEKVRTYGKRVTESLSIRTFDDSVNIMF